MKTNLFIATLFVILLACKKDIPFDQKSGEITVKQYFTDHGLEVRGYIIISGSTIKKFDTAVKDQLGSYRMDVHFVGEDAKAFDINVLFNHDKDAKWFMQALKAGDDASFEVKQWIENKRNLNIPVK